MSADTPTPETEEAIFASGSAYIMTILCRKLERERDAARARVVELEVEQEYQAIVFKVRDILKFGHVDNVAGELQTLWTRYNDALAQIANLEAAQTQQPLDMPDRPGWWWMKKADSKEYGACWLDVRQVLAWAHEPDGRYKWLPATPPPVTVISEKKGAR